MSQGTLLHEAWEEFGDEGESLPSLILAGPRGDGVRSGLGPNARLLTTFEAGSHYRLMGWGVSTTDQPGDHQPYPEEWLPRLSAR